MKSNLKNVMILLLMLALLLTSCSGKKSEDEEVNEEPIATETEQEEATPVATETEQEQDNEESMEDTSTTDETSNNDSEGTSSETEEEGEVEVGLLDRALLESVKFNWPDSYMMVAKEEDNDSTTIVTTYQKGYSSREERLTDDVTEIEIYNEKEGIRYSYTLGETIGTAYKDDEDDLLDIEEEKAMVGQSLMSLFEQDVWEDMKILADRDTINGRKAIMIEMVSTDPEVEYDGMIKFWFDAKYTVPLKVIFDIGEEWKSTTEFTDIEFNLKLKDDLFEAPSGVAFTEY